MPEPTQPTPTLADLTPAAAQPEPQDSTDWKAEARKWETRAKANNTAKSEAEERLAKALEAIAQAAGVKPATTPEHLAQQLAEAQQQNRQQAVHVAIMQKAATLGANPNALLNSLRFDRAIAALDPSDQAGIENAIQAEIQADLGLHAAAPAQ
ncbi:MAG: hypothetical protein ACRCWS_01650 [Propionibacteriaceae bacterium]